MICSQAFLKFRQDYLDDQKKFDAIDTTTKQLLKDILDLHTDLKRNHQTQQALAIGEHDRARGGMETVRHEMISAVRDVQTRIEVIFISE
jgi:hypothetical protein